MDAHTPTHRESAIIPSQLFPRLRLGRYRFYLKPESKLRLPAYSGSTWRGVIGQALSGLFCPLDRCSCQRCNIRNACAYYHLYEAYSGEKGFNNIPRPYIFYPQKESVSELCVEATLVGSAGDFLPHLIAAWVKAGEMGVGPGRGGFTVKEVKQLLPDGGLKTIFHPEKGADYERTVLPLSAYLSAQAPPPWTIRMVTPLRLRVNGKNAASPNWPHAFFTLAIRLSLLNQRYCGGDRPNEDAWNDMKNQFETLKEGAALIRWHDWKRHSSRQKAKIPMGGIVGECLVAPENHTNFWWRWWRAAELFHLGRGTTMGMGKISIG